MYEKNYTTLICSLPHLVNPFRYQSHTITLVQLEKRIKMLAYDDYVRVGQLRDLFYWGRLRLNLEETRLVRRATRFVDSLPYPQVREWLNWRMDVRSILSAMRQRKSGKPAPTTNMWGFGSHRRQIQTNWASTCFKLEHRYPFLPEANQLLQSGESLKLERLLLESIWRYYQQQTPHYPYGFSALVLYLAKWDLVDRWQRYDYHLGAKRFESLVNACLPGTEYLNQGALRDAPAVSPH